MSRSGRRRAAARHAARAASPGPARACTAPACSSPASSPTSSLRDFLLERVDEQLKGARSSGGRRARERPSDAQDLPAPRRGPTRRHRPDLPPGTYGELRDADGSRRSNRIAFTYGETTAQPARSARAPLRRRLRARQDDRAPFDARQPRVGRAPTTGCWSQSFPASIATRRRACRSPRPRTRSRGCWSSRSSSRSASCGLAVTTWLLVAASCDRWRPWRPTAGAIAAGDLSRRVEPAEHAHRGRPPRPRPQRACSRRSSEAFAERSASEEQLRRFLADASHELRTPLTSIRGYAELFRRGAKRRPRRPRAGDAPHRGGEPAAWA